MHDNFIRDCIEKQPLRKLHIFYFYSYHIQASYGTSIMPAKYINSKWQNHFLLKYSAGKSAFDKFISVLHEKRFLPKKFGFSIKQESEQKYLNFLLYANIVKFKLLQKNVITTVNSCYCRLPRQAIFCLY